MVQVKVTANEVELFNCIKFSDSCRTATGSISTSISLYSCLKRTGIFRLPTGTSWIEWSWKNWKIRAAKISQVWMNSQQINEWIVMMIKLLLQLPLRHRYYQIELNRPNWTQMNNNIALNWTLTTKPQVSLAAFEIIKLPVQRFNK